MGVHWEAKAKFFRGAKVMRRPILAMTLVGLAVALALALTKWLPSLRGTSPEAQVSQVLAEVERAMERLNFSEALDFVSKSYKDPSGNSFFSLKRAALRANKEVSFFTMTALGGWKVKASDREAIAQGKVFYYVLTHDREVDRDILDLTVYLRGEQGWWKIYCVEGLPSLEEF